MKLRIQALIPLSLAAVAATAFARDMPPDAHTTTFDNGDGKTIVHWGQPEAKDFGAPPPFKRLDARGAGYITSDEADAYPPLANDFIHADANRDGRITRAEYERWAKSH
jgi:hypothetical protein